MSVIYALDEAWLFDKLVRDLARFIDSPSEDGLLSVLFPLYHLREWICPGGHKAYESKPEGARTPEERLHSKLHDMHEYQIVRELCNRAKHFKVDKLAVQTTALGGLRAGLGKAGDSLGITHFLVDGREVREVFGPVYAAYFAHFRGETPRTCGASNAT